MISVPQVKGETGISCGVACLRSILDYYGIKVSEKEIFDKGVYFENTCPLISLGCVAFELGLNVEYLGFNPIVFPNFNESVSLDVLRKRSMKYYSLGKLLVDQTILFLERGGKITVKIPLLQDIQNNIKSELPSIIGIRPVFLRKSPYFNMNHYVIPIDYGDNIISCMDPAFPESQSFPNPNLMAAFYASMPELLIMRR